MSAAEAIRAARPSVVLSARGLVVSWVGSLGPAVARFETWSRERPAYVVGLGRAGAERAVVPALYASREALVVAWCEEDGAYAATIGDDGDRSEARLVVPDAVSVAFAVGDKRATLFAAVPDGFVSVVVDARGRSLGAPQRHLAERRADPLIAAAQMRDESVLVHAHRGDDAYGVITVRGAHATSVRHHASRRCESLTLSAVGGRAALALGLEGGRVRVGVLGGGGKVVERPHAVFPHGTEKLFDPHPVWTENRWTVLARERDSAVRRVSPLASGGRTFTMPQCGGPFAAAYFAQHLFTVEVEADGDGAEMRLARCAGDGSSWQQRVVALELDDARVRRGERSARRALVRLVEQMGRARGYREQGARPEVTPDGLTLRLSDDVGRLSVTLGLSGEGHALRVASALGEDPQSAETPTSLVRLARWVATKLSPTAREALEAERRWADELARVLDATISRLDRAGPTLVLDLLLTALPAPERLEAWLRRLRDEQRARLG